MKSQNKLEEILVNLYLGASTTQKEPNWRSQLKNPEIADALTAIHKEFAAELQRIGEEVIGKDEPTNKYKIIKPKNGVSYTDVKSQRDVWLRNDLRSVQCTRLSQIVKEYGGGDE